MRILDVFCGCGGFSLGFRKVFPDAEIIGIDLDRGACRTYQLNRVGQAIRGDVRHPPIRLDVGLFDVVIGGPPCEPFSIINTKNRGRNHPLYDLVMWFFFYVFSLQPAYFVMENVPELMKDPFYRRLIERLQGQRSLEEFACLEA